MKPIFAAVALLLVAAQDQDRASLKTQFTEKRDSLRGSTDADPYVDLGTWCVEQSLKDDAKWCFQKAWDLKPGHDGARAGMKKLGFDLENKLFRPIKEIYDRRRKALVPTDADARYELAKYIEGFGLEKDAKKEIETCLKVDPDHKRARTDLGFTRLYGEWLTAPEVEREKRIDEVWKAGLEANAAADALLADLKAAGYKGKLDDVKVALKFAASPRGTHKDVKLEAEKTAYPTGEYTYGVPDAYKPWRKNPLIVFLHGGGDGVGDGDDYFPQIWPHSAPKGYLTICPTVLEKISLAWNNPKHESYLRAIIKEFKTKYNVDEERTYLMGHSMGGFGCFYHGTRMTDLFAAISPWSGGPNQAVLSNLKHTPIYIIHGNRDAQVNVAGSRNAAKELTNLKYYHVYVEMDIDGHGVPGPEQDKAVDWLERFKLNPLAAQKKPVGK
jgi:predicted esterase